MRLRIQVNKTIFLEYKTRNTPEDFQKFIDGFLEWQCGLIKERLKEVVRRQVYTWSPLSKSYMEFKKRMGLDPRIWYASGQTLDSIKHWYVPLADAYFIGVHPRLKHRNYIKGGLGQKKGVRIIDIIRWMEFGTTKMPARPLFTKVLKEFDSKSVQTKLYADFIKTKKGLI